MGWKNKDSYTTHAIELEYVINYVTVTLLCSIQVLRLNFFIKPTESLMERSLDMLCIIIKSIVGSVISRTFDITKILDSSTPLSTQI